MIIQVSHYNLTIVFWIAKNHPIGIGD